MRINIGLFLLFIASPLFGSEDFLGVLDSGRSLIGYCEERFPGNSFKVAEDRANAILLNLPAEAQEASESSLADMCAQLRLLSKLERSFETRRGADCAPLNLEYSGPMNDEIRTLSADMDQVVTYLNNDRREARGAQTRNEVFRLSDALLDRQLKVFSQVNGLTPAADRNDKFLLRTVKDVELDESEFKRRSFVMKAVLDALIFDYERSGSLELSEIDPIQSRLEMSGHNASYGEIGDALAALRRIKERMDKGWNIGNAMPPEGPGNLLANQIEKFKNIRDSAERALDDSKTLKADEFYYYSYFIPSQKQETTVFVQPEDGAPYLPFKKSTPFSWGPSLSQAMGTKLVEGDIKQPEGFMEASWGHASANVLSGYGKAMYYRAHVNYGNDESEPARAKLRSTLKDTGLSGPKGGAIRIHADVGSVGCLELPIEDSVAVSGLAKSGNNPQMQTIPFPFTPENLKYFGNKVEGHGEFWKEIAKREAEKFEYAEAVPIDEVLNSATDSY